LEEDHRAVTAIDINSDLGEGLGLWRMGDDAALLEIVSSANVACGFHAGDPSIMRKVCETAAERGVAIGAHVSYPDMAGFGRRFMDVDPGELRDIVTYQIGALDAFARAAGSRVTYVKPHGALYNTMVHHEEQAGAVVAGIVAIGKLPMLGLAHSVALDCAQAAGLRPVREAFVDRAYNADGTLVARQQPGSVLHDVGQIVDRTVRMLTEGWITTLDGSEVRIEFDSLCVHGDTPGAVGIARGVREALEHAGIVIRPFTA
jgi:5-oxoprolinase (ATP-hydrolysing) subunit A